MWVVVGLFSSCQLLEFISIYCIWGFPLPNLCLFPLHAYVFSFISLHVCLFYRLFKILHEKYNVTLWLNFCFLKSFNQNTYLHWRYNLALLLKTLPWASAATSGNGGRTKCLTSEDAGFGGSNQDPQRYLP